MVSQKRGLSEIIQKLEKSGYNDAYIDHDDNKIVEI